MKFSCIMFSILALSSVLGSAQSLSKKWNEKKALRWFKNEAWLAGLTIKPHASTNALEFAKQYHANKALWDSAFAFLEKANFETLAPGKYNLKGDDLFVSVTEGPTKQFESTTWESHRKYVDIQFIYKGKEKLGVYPALQASTVTVPYNEAKDVMNYAIEEGEFYTSDTKTFFIFFPGDAHRPSIKVDGFDEIKKVVIKVRSAY